MGIAPANFTEFSSKFLEQFSILDDENMARDKDSIAEGFGGIVHSIL